MAQPLAGIRVVEVGGGVAGAAATKTFSDFGADVIKVEPPGGGLLRRLAPFTDDRPHLDRGAFHLALDTGKRSIVLELASSSGREVLSRLIGDAQLLVLDVTAVEARRLLPMVKPDGPSTVTITPHGLEGPYAERLEDDSSMFAWTTRMHHHAIAGEAPLRYAPYIATMQFGGTAAAAGSAAIWSREHEGERRDIEVPGVEALAGNVDSYFIVWSFSKSEQPRTAGQSKVQYPTGNYRCKDGYVMFAAGGERFFLRLLEAMGRSELAQDQRFSTPEAKSQHWADFMEYLGPWLEERTRQQVFEELQGHGVMVAPTLEVQDVMADPQAVVRGSYVTLEQPGAGATTLAGPPFRMAGLPEGDAWVPRPAPLLGEHTVELLDAAGYSRDEQMALFRAGVTG